MMHEYFRKNLEFWAQNWLSVMAINIKIFSLIKLKVIF